MKRGDVYQSGIFEKREMKRDDVYQSVKTI